MVVATADHSRFSNGARRIVVVRVRKVAAAIGPEAARLMRTGELVGMAGVGAVLGGVITVAGLDRRQRSDRRWCARCRLCLTAAAASLLRVAALASRRHSRRCSIGIPRRPLDHLDGRWNQRWWARRCDGGSELDSALG